MVSIAGYGAYVPVYRIERATIAKQHGDYQRSGEVAVPSYDEDHITMGISAAKEAVAHADIDGDTLDAVYVASVSDPFDEHGLAPHVAYAVDAGEDIRVADFGGSARASTTAIQAVTDAIEAGAVDRALVVATDIITASAGSTAEQTAGAGAGAVVLTRRDGDVATLQGIVNETTGFIGRFSIDGETPVEGDAKFNREVGYMEAVSGAIERLTEQGFTVTPQHAALASEGGDWGDRALSNIDLDASRHSTFDAIGYAGAASTLLDTVAALEATEVGEQVLAVSYGSGGSDAMLIETSTNADTFPEMTLQEYIDSKKYVTYAKHREYRAQVGGDA